MLVGLQFVTWERKESLIPPPFFFFLHLFLFLVSKLQNDSDGSSRVPLRRPVCVRYGIRGLEGRSEVVPRFAVR